MVEKEPGMSKAEQRKLALAQRDETDNLKERLLKSGGEAKGQEIPKTTRARQSLN